MENIETPIPESPDNCPDFTKYWNKFCKDVVERDNFKDGHLEQLAILCTLYVDYYIIVKQLQTDGMTFESDGGRNGPQTKLHPLVAEKKNILAEIRQYSKLLGLVLKEDKQVKAEPVDNWD